MPTANINGKAYDGVDISLQLLGNDINGFKNIDFKTTIASQNNHGKGKKPYSYSRGKKDYTGNIGIYAEVLTDIQDAIPGGDITDIPPFPIVVRMDNGTGRIVKHVLTAMFNETPGGGKTDDMGIFYDIPLHITNIVYIP